MSIKNSLGGKFQQIRSDINKLKGSKLKRIKKLEKKENR